MHTDVRFMHALNLSRNYQEELYGRMQMSESVEVDIKRTLSCQLPSANSETALMLIHSIKLAPSSSAAVFYTCDWRWMNAAS